MPTAGSPDKSARQDSCQVEPVKSICCLLIVVPSGVASLAKSLSRELASEGICVNNLAPGTINTGRPWQIYL